MASEGFDRRILTLVLIVFVNLVGATMVQPILPLYAEREFNMPTSVITLLFTAFFGAQFVAGPYLGRWSDTYGRVPVLILSQLGTVISFIMIASAQSFEVLFLARLLDGVTGGNIIVAQAYVTDIMPPHKRTQGLGYVFAGLGAGFIVGPALGGVLSSLIGARAPFLVAAVAASLTVLLTRFTLHETLTPQQRRANRAQRGGGLSPREVYQNTPLRLALIVVFVGQVGHSLLQSTFALYSAAVLFRGASEAVVNLGTGLLLSLVGVGQVLTQTLILPRLLQRYDEGWLVLLALVIRAAAMFTFALVSSPWLGAPTTLLVAVGIGVMLPSVQSLMTKLVADEWRGAVLGVYQSAFGLATIVGTAVSGTLFAVHPTFPYWTGGVLLVAALLPSWALYRWSHRSVAPLAGA